jgi:hypothetical protein
MKRFGNRTDFGSSGWLGQCKEGSGQGIEGKRRMEKKEKISIK